RHLRTGRPLAHARDEVLDDLEVDVRLEQREADLAHRLAELLVGEASVAAKVAERRLQLVGKRVKHEPAEKCSYGLFDPRRLKWLRSPRSSASSGSRRQASPRRPRSPFRKRARPSATS